MPFRSLCSVLVISLALVSCGGLDAFVPDVDPLANVDPGSIGNWTPAFEEVDGLRRFARTDGDRLIVSTTGGDRDFQAGVNIGATVPGRFPGELAVSAETYREWFGQIAKFGFTSIRIYTMLPPHFYDELRAYNLANADHPLLLIHGAWPPEEEIAEREDFYSDEVVEEFKNELSDLVDVVHGNAVVDERQARAHGTYTSDVSPWMLAWAVGIEWDAPTVLATDIAHDGMERFEGEYFTTTTEASPTESWMAMMLDHVATQEVEYGSTMPLAFVNWPTTDPIAHPYEPRATEDLVGLDPMHVRPTDRWPGGYFAGYHVYPYYPDFQRFEPGIADYVHNGEVDAYAGLLAKYTEHHAGIPFIVLEYGVPSGLAKAHTGPSGRDQGDHSEQEQAAINADLLRTIAEMGMAGGYLFEWTDEWFKLTWNTMNFEVADRRGIWMNAWTNEGHFGVVTYETGLSDVIVLDGESDDWSGNSRAISEGLGAVREVLAGHDEGYLYLRVVTDEPWSWLSEPLYVGFDVLEGDGAGLGPGLFPGADYRLVFDENGARVEVRSDADPMLNAYARLKYFSAAESEPGSWNLHRLLIKGPYVVPTSGEISGVEVDPAGILHQGTNDPNDEAFDSRATWFGSDYMIEMRIPWQAIGFADPSSRTVFDVGSDGVIDHVAIDRIEIGLVTRGELHQTDGYEWPTWNQVRYSERVKAGSDVFARKVIELNR